MVSDVFRWFQANVCCCWSSLKSRASADIWSWRRRRLPQTTAALWKKNTQNRLKSWKHQSALKKALLSFFHLSTTFSSWASPSYCPSSEILTPFTHFQTSTVIHYNRSKVPLLVFNIDAFEKVLRLFFCCLRRDDGCSWPIRVDWLGENVLRELK